MNREETRALSDAEPNRLAARSMCLLSLVLAAVAAANELGAFPCPRMILRVGCVSGIALFLLPSLLVRMAGERAWVKYSLLLLSVLGVTAVTAAGTYEAVLLYLLPLLLAAQYSNRPMTRFVYILSMLSVLVSTFAGYYFGLWDYNYISGLMPYDPIYAAGFAFRASWLTTDTISHLLLSVILPRCALLTLLFPLVYSVASGRERTARREMEARYAGDHDVMTGLWNKNKFLEMKQAVYLRQEEIGVVFFDINNLKSTNDSQGHARGDALIQKMAKSLLAFSGRTNCSYRIGGDEFLSVLTHCPREALDSFVQDWTTYLEALNQQTDGLYCSVAHGAAYGAGAALDELISEADRIMYAQKLADKQRGTR